MSQVWVSLHLPQLPLVALTIGTNVSAPMAVVEGQPRAQVVCANRRARAAGVCAGMSLASATALLPSLQLLPRNAMREADTVQLAALAASQFSPSVSIALPSSLTIEVATTIRMFGGLPRLVTQLVRDVRKLGIPVWPAAAPTARGAWLLARLGERHNIATLIDLHDLLDQQPVSSLLTAAPHLGSLQTLGLTRLTDVRKQVPAGLVQRFGHTFVEEIDRIYGDKADVLPMFVPPTTFSQTINLPVPIADAAMLQFALTRLVRALCHFLHLRGLGALRLEILYAHADITPTKDQIGVTLTRSELHLSRVLRERLQRLQLAAPTEAVTLTCCDCAPLASAQSSLLPSSDTGGDVYADDVMDRIRARLHPEAVYGLRLVEDHRPEKAFQKVVHYSGKLNSNTKARRPIWLLAEPEQLSRNPAESGYALTRGPERIETGWWDDAAIKRDYFVAEHRSGQRCWLFRDAAGGWFLHGYFS